MNGVAIVISSFLSFGVFHAHPNEHPVQWQWMIIANTIITFVTFILFTLFFPDNPTNAYFLTEDEKVKVVRRLRDNQTRGWEPCY